MQFSVNKMDAEALPEDPRSVRRNFGRQNDGRRERVWQVSSGEAAPPPYSSRIIKAGALLADTKTLLSHWDTDSSVQQNFKRLRHGNVFGKASRSRVEEILAIFRQEARKYWEELLAGKYEWSSIGKQLREKGLVK